MKIKYIVKAASTNRPFFLVMDVDVYGKIVPFAFRNCEQQEWNIAKFDTKEEGAIYTPIILEALVQEESD